MGQRKGNWLNLKRLFTCVGGGGGGGGRGGIEKKIE